MLDQDKRGITVQETRIRKLQRRAVVRGKSESAQLIKGVRETEEKSPIGEHLEGSATRKGGQTETKGNRTNEKGAKWNNTKINPA